MNPEKIQDVTEMMGKQIEFDMGMIVLMAFQSGAKPYDLYKIFVEAHQDVLKRMEERKQ